MTTIHLIYSLCVFYLNFRTKIRILCFIDIVIFLEIKYLFGFYVLFKA